MTLQERRAWIFLVVTVVAYTAYVVVVLGRRNGGPLADTDYQWPLITAVAGAVLASIVGEILLAVVRPVDTRLDVRDKEIGRLGDATGAAFVVIGGIAGLALAMAEWPYFWIANVIYLGFVVSAVLGSMTKIALYHRGMP